MSLRKQKNKVVPRESSRPYIRNSVMTGVFLFNLKLKMQDLKLQFKIKNFIAQCGGVLYFYCTNPKPLITFLILNF